MTRAAAPLPLSYKCIEAAQRACWSSSPPGWEQHVHMRVGRPNWQVRSQGPLTTRGGRRRPPSEPSRAVAGATPLTESLTPPNRYLVGRYHCGSTPNRRVCTDSSMMRATLAGVGDVRRCLSDACWPFGCSLICTGVYERHRPPTMGSYGATSQRWCARACLFLRTCWRCNWMRWSQSLCM